MLMRKANENGYILFSPDLCKQESETIYGLRFLYRICQSSYSTVTDLARFLG